MSRFSPRRILAFAAALVVAGATNAWGAFLWSNSAGSNANFDWANGQNETNLFGSPLVSTQGFVFFPSNFVANSVNGVAASVYDKAEVDISTKPSFDLQQILVREVGDYTITGSGPNAVNASATLFTLNLAQPLAPPTSATLTMTPTMPVTTGSGTWGGIAVQTFPSGVTQIHLILNNTLQATSSQGSAAKIEKKIGQIEIILIPEPTTAALCLAGAGLLLARRRR
jgi:hypothetical protein